MGAVACTRSVSRKMDDLRFVVEQGTTQVDVGDCPFRDQLEIVPLPRQLQSLLDLLGLDVEGNGSVPFGFDARKSIVRTREPLQDLSPDRAREGSNHQWVTPGLSIELGRRSPNLPTHLAWQAFTGSIQSVI